MVSTFATDNSDDIIELSDGKGAAMGELSIKYRPFLKEFLDDMSTKFELIIYSTFNSQYVKALVKQIEKCKKYFTYSFHDEFCLFANISCGLKCTDFLYGNRTLSDIIIVGDNVKVFPFSSDNFIPISVFTGDEHKDIELIKVATLLDKLAKEKDIPTAIRQYRESFE
jgi:CTD small phosphatase-like protein 2